VLRRPGPAVMGLALGLTLGARAPRAFAEGAKEYPPCGRQPTETDIAGAKGAFQAGQASFDEADYRRAIDYWEDAYRRDCTAHALLLNLARAYELNGEREQAVIALATYLERVPATPDQAKIQRRIDVLRRQFEAELATAPPPTTAAHAPPTTPAAAPPPQPAPIEPEPAPSSGHGRPILPLIVAGGGAAIAIAGMIVYIPAYSDLKDVEDDCPQHDKCPPNTPPKVIARGNELRTRVTIAGAFTVGGVVIAGAGLAWYFLSPSGRAQSSRSTLTPVVLPRYAGLSYTGAF
jgi:tetratricopeptide (TPR) repeat protein